MKFICKQLCGEGKYDTFKNRGSEEIDVGRNAEIGNVLHFLVQDYSICFKKMLMECLLEGVTEDPLTFIR